MLPPNPQFFTLIVEQAPAFRLPSLTDQTFLGLYLLLCFLVLGLFVLMLLLVCLFLLLLKDYPWNPQTCEYAVLSTCDNNNNIQ